MKRAALLFAMSLLVVSCATMGGSGQDLVSRGVTAMGGAEALAGVKTLYVQGSVKHWEPEQSAVAGGDMRFAADANFETVMDVTARTSATDWSKRLQYPSPRPFVYTEIVTPELGYVYGIDTNGRTKQSIDSKPPAHNMSGLRLATTQRELRRTSPLLLLEMQKNRAAVAAVADVTVGSASYPAVEYRPTANQAFIVMFDRATGLPARIRTLDYDGMLGDVNYDLVLSDWKAFDKIQVATTQNYELNGRTVVETKLRTVGINASFADDRLQIPDAYKTGAKPATGVVPYQWVIRRQFIGTYLDSEVPSFDSRAVSSLRLVQLAPGVQHVTGGSHHSLIVEMKDHLIVFDAPVSDWHSTWVIGAAQVKYTGKPIKYLVLTHHHMDHASGFRAYAAQGASIVVGKGTGAHYRKLLAAPYTRNPDLAAKDLSKTPVIEVDGKHVLTDGTREVQALVIDGNPHADGLLIGFIPDAKLGFVTDIWSPGAGPMPPAMNPALTSLVNGVKKYGIMPEKFAGGHGSTADYAPLHTLAGN
jgi:glyoxylase-like metal-dependent hydrolase (beta-lactamase superfamily II)